jgi:hypothetical protein
VSCPGSCGQDEVVTWENDLTRPGVNYIIELDRDEFGMAFQGGQADRSSVDVLQAVVPGDLEDVLDELAWRSSSSKMRKSAVPRTVSSGDDVHLRCRAFRP